MINPCPSCRHPMGIASDGRFTSVPSGPMRKVPPVWYWVQCSRFECHQCGPRRETEADAIADWNKRTFFGWVVIQENEGYHAQHPVTSDWKIALEDIEYAVSTLRDGMLYEEATNAALVVQLAGIAAAAVRFAEFLMIETPMDEVRALVTQTDNSPS